MMPTKFVEAVGGKLAEQWIATLLTPAFCFWIGGLYAWAKGDRWLILKQQLEKLDDPLQLAALIGALLIVTTSAFAIQQFEADILRILEGYCPRWLFPVAWIYRRLLSRQRNHLRKVKENWAKLNSEREQLFTSSEHPAAYELFEKLALLEHQRHWLPSQPKDLMPTKLGNILRSSELRPWHKYGLDSVICWPHLWLLLPESARSDLQSARATLNASVRIWIWSVLFSVVWVWWAWWALPVGILVATFAYHWLLSAARTYGSLVEATFDLYRVNLYRALRFAPPTSSEEEREKGQLLTDYLWRGAVRPILFQNLESR
jgi:hypothetical protein